MIGTQILHYRVEAKLGEGGMGDVYLAHDTKLDRQVALKFLPERLTQNEEARARLHREAKAASQLNHPNILTVYAVEEHEGRDFIAAEYVDGKPLTEYWADCEQSNEHLVGLLTQIAEGLIRAHEAGIVHRDIKPQNVLVNSEGTVKILDFGLAKLRGATQLTAESSTLGTIDYMSPEQAHGEEADQRTDIWSLGAVLYQLLTGKVPFRGDYPEAIVYSILNEDPVRPSTVKEGVPEELEQMTLRALAKDRSARYGSMEDVLKDLSAYRAFLTEPADRLTPRYVLRQVKRPRFAIPAVILLGLMVAAVGWMLDRRSKVNWARQVAIPEIMRIQEQLGDIYNAFGLAREAEKYIPGDSLLLQLWPKISSYSSLKTDPPGADVYRKPYEDVDGPWEHLGRTPLDSVRYPWDEIRLRIEKEGYHPVITLTSGGAWDEYTLPLDTAGSLPEGMVRIPEDVHDLRIPGLIEEGDIRIGSYLLDRYEISNREYKQFVDDGGYQRSEFWVRPFVREGDTLSWREAMSYLKDRTGRPGPATWEVGGYTEDQDDYPVTGVSWYEAAAYAVFADKSLPTLYHWYAAAGFWYYASDVIPLSNFSSEGLAARGTYEGMTPWGAYDMAGNVREWCWNEIDNQHYIMGGGWNDPEWTFTDPHSESPWNRSAMNGIRCVKYLQDPDSLAQFHRPIHLPRRDYYAEEPCNDEAFEIYLSQYAYDRTDLNAQIDTAHACTTGWTTERVTFEAAYSGPRMVAYILLPEKGAPPYQTLVYFPGSYANYLSSICELINAEMIDLIDWVLKSGRAFVYPAYFGTGERESGKDPMLEFGTKSQLYKEYTIKEAQDMRRCIDYLGTRTDIDTSRLAYYGFSWGGALAPIMVAVEPRFKTALIYTAGLYHYEFLPEVDAFNFVTRVKLPLIMVTGRYDALFGVEESQKPMFEFFGTPDEHKKLVLVESGHWVPKEVRVREFLDWLDKYLGPVQ